MKMIEQSDKIPHSHSCRGNAMVYILVALALIGFLTLTLSNQNNQADGQDLSDEMAEFYASELMNYVASAQQAIDMMQSTGTDISELNFVKPSEAAFNTGSHIHKVFHPQGGGLNYEEKFSPEIQNGANAAWHLNANRNVAWTNGAGDDVVITAYFIQEQICALINKSITGSSTIPATASPHAEYFIDGTTALDAGECAGCENYPTLCVANDAGDNYSFYSIIAAQ